MLMATEYPYTVEFFIEDNGSSPVGDWILDDLTPAERRAVTAALRELVAAEGHDICKTDFGKNLGGGIIELRLRQSEAQILKRIGREPDEPHPEDDSVALLLRVFFHPYGQKRVLVLHGYGKGRKPSKSHQQEQIEVARGRLTQWKQREQEREKATKKGAKR
jgi:phage-related protein